MVRGTRRALTRLIFVATGLSAVGLPGSPAAGAFHLVPLFPEAASPHWEGLARVINHSDEPGTVRIVGIDDSGVQHGPVELSLEARATMHFSSRDLESGSPGKGLHTGLGDGEGNWRLRLSSDLDIEPLSYIRTEDGFVTAMHERVPAIGRRHRVRFFNPASNASQVSRLRLINPNEIEVNITIEGRDDSGAVALGGVVRVSLAPGEARTFTSQQLEEGADDLTGTLGDGVGKWQLFIRADTPIEVVNLLQSPTGHLTNLSGPGRNARIGGAYDLPLLMPASEGERQSFVRIINHSDETGEVHVHGIDDEGEWYGPVVLSLAPGAVAQFSSTDLEEGNTDKGLSGAFGDGVGSWRLRFHTGLDIEPLAYVHTVDGFMTSMHELVRESALNYHVPLFNPGSNRAQVSWLRIVNPTEDVAEVTIAGRDDAGQMAPGGEVHLTLNAGAARALTSQELEAGGAGFSGSFGDGLGRWQLFVTADTPVQVMSLLESPTGHLANLSISSVTGFVTKEGIDRPVTLNTIVSIPPEVASVEANAVTTTVLGTESGGTPPDGTPALLVASDANGAVMYALVNEDGGFLGEETGTVRVSVASTAAVLVALAAGYRIPSISRQVVETILSHADYGRLIRQLIRLMSVDESYLTRLSDYPDVVASLQKIAAAVTGDAADNPPPNRAGSSAVGARSVPATFAAGVVSLQHRNRKSAVGASSVPAIGITKQDFYCAPLVRVPCSPWNEHEPWHWFGDARGAEAYKPDGTGWRDWLLALVPGGIFLEGYEDFLEEAENPPFLARTNSKHSLEVHAAANPGFARYAMELYAGSTFQGWYYVPGNTSTLNKLKNSGAAYREVLAGTDRFLNPDVDRVRFQRYRLTLAAGGNQIADHAAVVSFFNTFHMLTSTASVVTDVSVVDRWLEQLAADPRLYVHVASCAKSILAEHYLETNDPNLPVAERMLTYFGDFVRDLFGNLLADEACLSLVRRSVGEKLERLLQELVARAGLDAVVNALSVVRPLLSAANDAIPVATSYLAPQAARSEYHVQWNTIGGQPYIEQASEAPIPVAAFTYAQQQGLRVELDGSKSEGERLNYVWVVEEKRIGTGPTVVHDFPEAGEFEVTLKVSDRHGAVAVESGRVKVTAGRIPVVRSLRCAPTGDGMQFSMEADVFDADDDIDSVHWFSNIGNSRPDDVTDDGRSRVTLLAPFGMMSFRAKVKVVDARGNEAERNCPVEFESGLPVPRVSGASAEEGKPIAFTVALDKMPSESMTYYYATYRGSAASQDYSGHDTSALRFGVGEQTKTVTVRTTEDKRIENDETFYLYVAESRGDLTIALPTRYLARAVGTIVNDDVTSLPSIALPVSDAEAKEGEPLEFTVTLDRVPRGVVTYYYATVPGTADDDDYVGYDTAELRFDPGELSKTITVRTTEDDRIENDEIFYLYVAKSRADFSSPTPTRHVATAIGTIRDDDEPKRMMFRDCIECPLLVDVPEGSFDMGSSWSESETEYNETPLHFVEVSQPFAVGVHEVTRGQWREFENSTRYSTGDSCWTYENGDWRLRRGRSWQNPGFTQNDDHPVVCVSWDDAQAYVNWLSEKTGQGYRLLSESEWEYIARAETMTSRYWGDDRSEQCSHANGADQSTVREYEHIWERYGSDRWRAAPCDDGYPHTAPTGTFTKNGFGLYDVLGNAWEWVEDCPSDDYRNSPTDQGAHRTIVDCGFGGHHPRRFRGGGWSSSPASLRAARRDKLDKSDRTSDLGFRVVRADDVTTGTDPAKLRVRDAEAQEGEEIEFTVTLDRALSSAVSYYYATYPGTAQSGDFVGHDVTTLRFSAGERSKTVRVRTTEDDRPEDDERFYLYIVESREEAGTQRPTRYLARATGTIRDDDESEPETGFAPEDQQQLDSRIVGKRVEYDFTGGPVAGVVVIYDHPSAGRFRTDLGVGFVVGGRYSYTRNGPNSGTVTSNFEGLYVDGATCVTDYSFSSAVRADFVSTCTGSLLIQGGSGVATIIE